MNNSFVIPNKSNLFIAVIRSLTIAFELTFKLQLVQFYFKTSIDYVIIAYFFLE